MRFVTVQKISLTALAALAVFYGLVVLWYVPTQPTIPLNCLVTNSDGTSIPGLEIRDVSRLRDCMGATPEVGDHIIQAAGRPIRSFADWVRVHQALRNWKVDPAARIPHGKDPSEDGLYSNISVFEYPDKSRCVIVWFLRPGTAEPLAACVPLIPQPTFSVSVTLLWFALQLCVVAVGGLAFWNRPFDQPVRTFFALASVTMMAFVGGSHWWIIAASPTLIILFAIAGLILPAVLLNFFLVYPYPAPLYERGKPWTSWSLYVVPAVSAAILSTMILAASWGARDWGQGPFAETLEQMLGTATAQILPVLRQTVFVMFGISAAYFVLSLIAILRSLKVARNALERNQVRSLLWAGVVATVLIGYTIWLAITHQVEFALGAGRLPMFGASLAFMLAYGIGIARYKLMLLDQVVTRGVWYYTTSAGLAVIFAALIAFGAVNVLHENLSLFGQSMPLALVLMTAVLLAGWVRDAIQRMLDRRYFSEKYQLDKALNRMNQVVSGVLEPEAVADSLLNCCREILHIDHAALYLRRMNRLEFRMLTAVGRGHFPLQIPLEPEAFEALSEGVVLQRVPQSRTPNQQLLRQLKAEVVHGLEMQGQLGGLLVLGTRPHHSQYSAEDFAFISAMARISGIGLHCANVQQDVARLNDDLQRKIDKIDDQERQLSVLHQELASLSTLPGTKPAADEFRRSGIKGHSPAITSVLETIRKVAGSDSSVLLRGESGTGKELMARAIHENSPRAAGPLVSVHCAALSPALLESELFGHVKGAFTDARGDKIGRFQMADGGTLFLDEIGDISLDVQVKLLRVLQERSFEPVGGTQSVSVNVRIVAATHRNLERLIAEGKFREDLFYRLNVISVTLPRLRERQDDLFELAIHFLRRAAEKAGKNVMRIEDDALKHLQAYDWPGNIRELQNVIERAVVLAEGDAVRLSDLQIEHRARAVSKTESTPEERPLRSASGDRIPQIALRRKTLGRGGDERKTLQSALEDCDGNKAEAARLLGMPRSTFFSKLKKHGLS